MDHRRWEAPISFETAKLGVYLTISSTAEAARVLLDHWPIDNGQALTAAKHACIMVLEGNAAPETARAAFVMAANEAGVFIRHL